MNFGVFLLLSGNNYLWICKKKSKFLSIVCDTELLGLSIESDTEKAVSQYRK